MLDRINSNNSGPELNSENLVWLTEMGINYGLLKTYNPVITENIITKTNNKNTASHDLRPKAPQDEISQSYYQKANNQTVPQPSKNILKNVLEQQTTPIDNSADKLLEIAAENIDVNNLDKLYEFALNCKNCQLHSQRDQMVFGFGHANNPELMIIGEAPGRADDASGHPFQGKAGKLLHFMLLSIGIYADGVSLGPKPQPVSKYSQASNVYFTNIVKCRPVGNRSPSDIEIQKCHSLLKKQIELIKPKAILLMGSLAAKSLLGIDQPLEQLRAKTHYIDVDEQNIAVVATWHPASLLLQPQNKALAWADLQLLKTLI